MSLGEEGTRNLFNHVMEIWVNPEIERRKKQGSLEENYEIDKIQIVIRHNDVPLVRFNEEVKAIVLAKLKAGVRKNIIGEPVSFSEIEDIQKIEMTDEDDPNWGHLTMVLFPKGWNISFDFRTNKKLAHERYQVGQDFLKAAQIPFDAQLFRPFIDVLFSAVELFVTAQLFVMAEQKYIMKPRHPSTSLKYNQYINTGNYKSEFKELFNKLSGMRDVARYLKGVFEINDHNARNMLETAKELAIYTDKKIL